MTKTQRATIIKLINADTSYDAATVRINADGVITARLDADKTYAGNDPARYLVGHVDDFANGANPFRAP